MEGVQNCHQGGQEEEKAALEGAYQHQEEGACQQVEAGQGQEACQLWEAGQPEGALGQEELQEEA